MNNQVASLELCKRLHELKPEWNDTFIRYAPGQSLLYTDEDTTTPLVVSTVHGKHVELEGHAVGCDECEGELMRDLVPAYDSGYLLRKLPQYTKDQLYRLTLQPSSTGWCSSYDDSNGNENKTGLHYADTPEDALALLAIKLAEEKII